MRHSSSVLLSLLILGAASGCSSSSSEPEIRPDPPQETAYISHERLLQQHAVELDELSKQRMLEAQSAGERLTPIYVQLVEHPLNAAQRSKAGLLHVMSSAELPPIQGTGRAIPNGKARYAERVAQFYGMLLMDARDHIELFQAAQSQSGARAEHAGIIARMLEGGYSPFMQDVFTLYSLNQDGSLSVFQPWTPDQEQVIQMTAQELQDAGVSDAVIKAAAN